ncbi:hypothetical protein L873DRAFT_1235371 [Choiromyces venosus 120613-1]|uniref:Uncharacterized protein n=1 Tax=Choiromyces venosus 120613-1 TaxID=1336337 RepID=A0A3N4JHX7_9PEZI|nr:hypothetical protein L873DRAFT_1235371 [Choiromyces venosus 120613-1]
MTRWISYRIASVVGDGAKYSGYQLLRSLSKQSRLRPSAGWFLEAYVHQWFRQGGKFEANRLPVCAIDATSKPMTPSGQSGPWSGLQIATSASPAMILKSVGQLGLKYVWPPKSGRAQAAARSSG